MGSKNLIPSHFLLVTSLASVCAFAAHQSSSKRSLSPGQAFNGEALADGSQATGNRVANFTRRFAVHTDGGPRNGSKYYQSTQSYSPLWGGNLNTSKIMGAVNIDNNGLKGGDLICYTNLNNKESACGVIIDNGFKKGQSIGRTRHGHIKPPEATAAIHRALGAQNASGGGTDLANAPITAVGIKLQPQQKAQLTQALKAARKTGNYTQANKLIQQLGRDANNSRVALNSIARAGS